MSKIRCLYSKTGRAKFISHLDLMATFKRSFLRAGVGLTYSEGFNPHPYISVALPLAVGHESVCEVIDVGFSGKEFPKNINDFLPNGISILEVYAPERKTGNIKWIKVECIVSYDNRKEKRNVENPQTIAHSLRELFSEQSIIISKKSKRGIKDIDIAPHIKCESVRTLDDFNFEISAIISAQDPTVSHNDFLSVIALSDKCQFIENFLIRRIEIYDENMVVFR